MAKKLYRSKNKVIAGVCAGIAEHMNVDPTVVRVIWVIATLLTGIAIGVIAYLICWAMIPEK